jgi:hypothetical protein
VFSNLLLLSGLEIQGTMFRHGMHAIARYHLVRCLECLLSLLYFFILFFGLLFFEIFSVCFPSTVIKRQEGASILCLAGRCGAVVSDFFFTFSFCCPVPQRGDGGISAPIVRRRRERCLLLCYTTLLRFFCERRKSGMFSLIRHSREEDLGTD